MKPRKYLEDYKNEMIGNAYGWLTILDVFRDESNHRVCKCRCKCGNVVIKDMRKVYSGHTTSCGCYNKSEEKCNKLKQSWENNPDRKEKQATKLTQYYTDHPDKANEISEKLTSFYKENPDKAAERSIKYLNWVTNNYEKVLEIGKLHSQFYRDNPDVAKVQGEKISQFYKNNPEKLKERAAKRAETLKNNPDIQKSISKKNTAWRANNQDKFSEIATNNSKHYKLLRSLTDYSSIINYVDPSQVDDLINGNLSSTSIIRTKCPTCGKYSEHTLCNVFRIKTQDLKFNTIPMCKECYNSFSIISSRYEKEIADYISTFYNGECIRNSREIISPLELDLYYPEKKIAIEFNGDYWHSDKFKDKDYHYNKFKSCLDKGIILVSIFEHDWLNIHNEIKEYLMDLFNDKLNKLSFVNNYINNNYPPPYNTFAISNNHVFDEYSIGENVIYDCGYTIIS